jgi:hypothetical protein
MDDDDRAENAHSPPMHPRDHATHTRHKKHRRHKHHHHEKKDKSHKSASSRHKDDTVSDSDLPHNHLIHVGNTHDVADEDDPLDAAADTISQPAAAATSDGHLKQLLDRKFHRNMCIVCLAHMQATELQNPFKRYLVAAANILPIKHMGFKSKVTVLAAALSADIMQHYPCHEYSYHPLTFTLRFNGCEVAQTVEEHYMQHDTSDYGHGMRVSLATECTMDYAKTGTVNLQALLALRKFGDT